MIALHRLQKAKRLFESMDLLFSTGFDCCHRLARSIWQYEDGDGMEPIACLHHTYTERKSLMLMSTHMLMFEIPKNVWCLRLFDAALYSLNAAYDLMSGHISWDSYLFAEYIKGISTTPQIVRCPHHVLPKPLTAEGSQFQYLRAQELIINLTGSNNRS